MKPSIGSSEFPYVLCTIVVQNTREARRILFGHKRLRKRIRGKSDPGSVFFVPSEPFAAISFLSDLVAAPPRCEPYVAISPALQIEAPSKKGEIVAPKSRSEVVSSLLAF
jgi:hypothetical protein